MKVQRARYEVRTCPLSSEFGEAMAHRWFTSEDLASWPRLSNGKNYGKLKGVIEWHKVNVGGWHRNKNGLGGVLKPGTQEVTIIRNERECGQTTEIRKQSAGRVGQPGLANHHMKGNKNATPSPNDDAGRPAYGQLSQTEGMARTSGD